MKDLLTDFKTSSESINYEARVHWISYVIPVFFTVIGSVGVLYFLLLGYKFMLGFMGIISLFLIFLFIKGIIKIIRNKNTKIYVTDNHLSFSTGILGKTLSDLSLNKLEGMQLQQSFLGKTLNFGTLVVTTGGMTHSYFIENPMELRSALLHSQKAV
ncbi:PH domain-containing protein [Chryseobacterium sp. RP-3-3]|uniref:PH domain-containing protein n=1 Tax=Chryseobacterium antibioticum TaxID=2728847 RepID=A0A7Y0FSL9_9FLAO|nr:PH domain-containing protein [Chryseobacterium antibioticum]NML70801.1 PH domain-containing protein [Chryseobacterium antibioticum]